MEEPAPDPPPSPEPAPVLNPLTGLPVDDPAALGQRPIVVTLDNHPSARPQAGLTLADLVYELPAEGGITRLVAVFMTRRPERVGPVRSSRHYFLDIAREWDALYVHAGGSPQHYARIGETGLGALDGVRSNPKGGGNPVFTRDSSRRAPHNLYASLPVAVASAEEQGWRLAGDAPVRAPFRFFQGESSAGDGPVSWEGEPARQVTIRWPGWSRGWVRYVFQDDGRYRRETAFGPHRAEETGQVVAPANLLIQFVPARAITGDEEGRLEVDVVGQGRLLVVNNGQVREGSWEKAGSSAPTVWRDADGGPVWLQPGPTWIHVVPSSTAVDIEGGTGDGETGGSGGPGGGAGNGEDGGTSGR